VAPLIFRFVHIGGGQLGIDRADQQRGEGIDLVLGEMEVGHAQPLGLRLLFALVVDRRILQLVLEKALVVVPAILFLLWQREREIEALDRLAAFLGQLRSDAALIFNAGALVAAGAAVVANEVQALLLQRRIIHVRRGGIARVVALPGDQVRRDVTGLLPGEPQ